MEKLSVCIIESRNRWHVFAVRLHLSSTNRFGSSLSLALKSRWHIFHRATLCLTLSSEYSKQCKRRFKKRVLRYKDDMIVAGQFAQEEKLQAQETKGDSQSTFKR